MKDRKVTPSKPVTLENWSLVPAGKKISLRGNVFNDQSRQDGTQVLTAVITNVARPFVTTSNGAEYKLGAADIQWSYDFPGCVERFWAAANRI